MLDIKIDHKLRVICSVFEMKMVRQLRVKCEAFIDIKHRNAITYKGYYYCRR